MLDDVEDWIGEGGDLYHGTSTRHVPGILAHGMRAPSCWGSRDMALHFAREECRRVGGRPCLFRRPLASFDPAHLRVDEEMVDFPLEEVIGLGYDVLGCLWEEAGESGGQTWRNGLRLYQSVVCGVGVALSQGDLEEVRGGGRAARHRAAG